MEDFKKEILIKTNSKIYYEDNLEMQILELSESALKDFFRRQTCFSREIGGKMTKKRK